MSIKKKAVGVNSDHCVWEEKPLTTSKCTGTITAVKINIVGFLQVLQRWRWHLVQPGVCELLKQQHNRSRCSRLSASAAGQLSHRASTGGASAKTLVTGGSGSIGKSVHKQSCAWITVNIVKCSLTRRVDRVSDIKLSEVASQVRLCITQMTDRVTASSDVKDPTQNCTSQTFSPFFKK